METLASKKKNVKVKGINDHSHPAPSMQEKKKSLILSRNHFLTSVSNLVYSFFRAFVINVPCLFLVSVDVYRFVDLLRWAALGAWG